MSVTSATPTESLLSPASEAVIRATAGVVAAERIRYEVFGPDLWAAQPPA